MPGRKSNAAESHSVSQSELAPPLALDTTHSGLYFEVLPILAQCPNRVRAAVMQSPGQALIIGRTALRLARIADPLLINAETLGLTNPLGIASSKAKAFNPAIIP